MTMHQVTALYWAPVYVRHDVEAETPEKALEEIEEVHRTTDDFWCDDEVDVESGGRTIYEVRGEGGKLLASTPADELAPEGSVDLLKSIRQRLADFSKRCEEDQFTDTAEAWEVMSGISNDINALGIEKS